MIYELYIFMIWWAFGVLHFLFREKNSILAGRKHIAGTQMP